MRTKNRATSKVLCFGELLWDCLPRGLFLGGAPANTAYHLRRLGSEALPVSATGSDLLGDEARERLAGAGVPVRFIHLHKRLPTGTVKVSLDRNGNAAYTIREPVAWDRIPVSPDLENFSRRADCLLFGTLAQRSGFNRSSLARLLRLEGLLKVYDVNLRPPFDPHPLVFELAGQADILKLNEEELHQLVPKASPRRPPLEKIARRLAGETGARAVCVTRGAKGAVLLYEDSWYEMPGRKVTARDTVGAGDAFLAALVHFLLKDPEAPERALRAATRLGEFIATREGAMPAYDAARLKL